MSSRRTSFVTTGAPMIALAMAVLAVVVAGPAVAARPAVAPNKRSAATLVDVADQAAISAAYRATVGAASSVTASWTGASTGCLAGTASQASQDATVASVNFARALNGLAPVQSSPNLAARAQQTALLMAANGAIDHHPAATWACSTPIASEGAASSLLAQSYGTMTAGEAVTQYLADPGTTNTAAGHRRWLLDPMAYKVGTGMTDSTDAYYVMGETDAHRANPAWVAWPAAGWFPSQLEPGGRWSLGSGYSTADFSSAKVAVVDMATGAALPVTVQPVVAGIAMPTLVFDVAGVSPTATYRVTITGIKGAQDTRRRYQVRLFAA